MINNAEFSDNIVSSSLINIEGSISECESSVMLNNLSIASNDFTNTNAITISNNDLNVNNINMDGTSSSGNNIIYWKRNDNTNCLSNSYTISVSSVNIKNYESLSSLILIDSFNVDTNDSLSFMNNNISNNININTDISINLVINNATNELTNLITIQNNTFSSNINNNATIMTSINIGLNPISNTSMCEQSMTPFISISDIDIMSTINVKYMLGDLCL